MFSFKFGRTKANEQKKQVPMEGVHHSNMNQPDDKYSSSATCTRSLFSGLSLHNEVTTTANEDAISHMNDLQDLSFPVNPLCSMDDHNNRKMTGKVSGTSKFGFINRGGVTDKSDRQTSLALPGNGQLKVKKKRKAKRFGHQSEDKSSEISEAKDRRSSCASDTSDSASLISGGSDLATQTSQQFGITQKEGTLMITESNKSDSSSEESLHVMPSAANKVTREVTNSAMANTDNEANALSIIDSDRMLSSSPTNEEKLDVKSGRQSSSAEVSASGTEENFSESEKGSLDRSELCAPCHDLFATYVVPMEQEESPMTEVPSWPSTKTFATSSQVEVESCQRIRPPLNLSPVEVAVVASSEESWDDTTADPCIDQTSGSDEQILQEEPMGCRTALQQEVIPAAANKESSISESIYDMELDDSDKMELSLQALEARLNIIKEDRDSLTTQRTFLLSEVRGSLVARSRLLGTIQSIRSQQLDAVERDDFDEAERLNNQLEQCMKEANENSYRHPLLDPKVTDLMLSFKKMLLDHNHEYKKLLEEYGVVAHEQKQAVKAVSDLAHQDKARRRNDLMKERSELERSLNHISLDKEYCLKQEQEIQSVIQERTSTLNQERADLQLEKQLVEKQITELKEQLALLETKNNALSTSLRSLDNRIDGVKAEFANQLALIAKEEREIEEKEWVLNQGLENLEDKEKRFSNEDAIEDGKLTRLENLAETLKGKMENVAVLVTVNDVELTELTHLVDLDAFKLVSSEPLINKKKETEALGKEVKGMASQIIQSREAAANARKELTLLESEIIEVKRAKELAVSERKFQDAKALAATLNSLTAQVNCIKEDMETSAEKAARLTEILDTLKPKYELCQTAVLELEKCRDEKYVKQLASATSSLMDFLASKENALWISPILELQIEFCQVIGKELSKQHDIYLPSELATLKSSSLLGEEVDINMEATTDTVQLSKEMEELEARLNVAVEREDFDEADEIHMTMGKLRRKMEQTLS